MGILEFLKKNLIIGYCLAGILLTTSMVYAQDAVPDDPEQMKYLDQGIREFDNAEYEAADVTFRQVLGSVKVLPAEICYYFGANSYYLGKYKQSINWLNKYIELKGTTGQYFDQCTAYLNKAQEKYMAANTKTEETVYDPGREIDYTVMPVIDCGPAGKIVCPVCKGQTVIIKRSALGYDYRSCRYCDTHGYLTCDEYNQLLQGKLTPKSERSSQ
jgi:hypothetical protein